MFALYLNERGYVVVTCILYTSLRGGGGAQTRHGGTRPIPALGQFGCIDGGGSGAYRHLLSRIVDYLSSEPSFVGGRQEIFAVLQKIKINQIGWGEKSVVGRSGGLRGGGEVR